MGWTHFFAQALHSERCILLVSVSPGVPSGCPWRAGKNGVMIYETPAGRFAMLLCLIY